METVQCFTCAAIVAGDEACYLMATPQCTKCFLIDNTTNERG